MVREICEVLEGRMATAPLILILEDLHWIDNSTLDFISAFARRREPAKLLLIGTYRPADVALSHGFEHRVIGLVLPIHASPVMKTT